MTHSPRNPSSIPFLAHAPCVIPMPTWMPALRQALQSWLAGIGEHGALCLGGIQMDMTLHGQRPLVLNYWSGHCSDLVAGIAISKFLGTTKQLSMVGGMGGAITIRSMPCFVEFTHSQKKHIQPSTPNMLKVPEIQQSSCRCYPPRSLLLPPVTISSELMDLISEWDAPPTTGNPQHPKAKIRAEHQAPHSEDISWSEVNRWKLW